MEVAELMLASLVVSLLAYETPLANVSIDRRMIIDLLWILIQTYAIYRF